MALGLRGSGGLRSSWGHLLLVEHLYLSCSSHASVAAPLNLFDLARSHIYLEGAVAPDSTFPILPGNSVVTCGQRDPKPALIISREGCNRVISLLYDKSSIRTRSRIGNAQSRRPTMNGADRNHPFEPCFRFRRGLCLCQDEAGKHGEQHHNYWEGLLFAHRVYLRNERKIG